MSDATALVDEAEAAEAEAEAAEALAAAARTRARNARERSRDRMPSANESDAAVGEEDQTDATAIESVDDHIPVPTNRRTKLHMRRPRLTTVVVGMAILCSAALIAASIAMSVHHRNVLAQQQRAAEFTAAARQVAVTLMSIDAQHASDDVQRIVDSSTGQFRDDFTSAADEFVKVAKDANVSTTATAQAAAVESMTEDGAVVLVAANSTITNAAGAREQPRSWRLVVALVREGGQIKMSSVEFVP